MLIYFEYLLLLESVYRLKLYVITFKNKFIDSEMNYINVR